jgi:cyclic pyranopterin phosphate synthase
MRYLRVSLTCACNLKCFYCRPNGSQAEHLAGLAEFDQVEASIRLLTELGVNKVRFTGGEPTLFKRLPELVASVKAYDSRTHTAITTNGMLLEKLAPVLARAGLDSANISLDTVNRARFEAITGADGLKKIINGIRAARKHLLTVKLNCVAINRVNDDEFTTLVSFANDEGVDIRFIEFMPSKINSNLSRGYIPGDKIRRSLPWPLVPLATPAVSAAVYYGSPALRIRVGFINPVSHPFCSDCNRLRLASNGRLYGCLFSGESLNLFDLLKTGAENRRRKIEELVAAKQFIGCTMSSAGSSDLPSFVNLGG